MVIPPVSHCLLITSEGGGSHFNENGPHHKNRFGQVHPQFRLKNSKHTDNVDRTIHKCNILDKIRLAETAVIPVGKVGRVASNTN